MPGGAAPATITQAVAVALGAVLYALTFYLISSGLITVASYAKLGSAPAISGILLAIAQIIKQFGDSQPAGSVLQIVSYAVAGAIVALTYWLVQQGWITAKGGK